jgi:hypothetical protein
VATPYDDDLARLNRELTGTVLGFGSTVEQAASARKVAARAMMPATSAAAAASYSAKSARMNKEDLVTAVETGEVRLEEVPADALPPSLKPMSGEERTAHVKSVAKKRQAINARILELAKQREGYLKDAGKKAGAGDGFDGQVLDMLRTQAEAVDVDFE